MARPFTILTICSGNICRSPLAELLLRSALAGVVGVQVVSAGTIANEGDRMPDQALALAARLGVDGADHSARYLIEHQASSAGLVFAMAREHRSAAVALWPRATRYTFTLREFARLSAGIGDAQLASIAALPLDDTTARLTALVALVAEQRGSVEPAEFPEDDDVIDPYRRDDETYELSGRQLAPAADAAGALIRRALEIV